MAKYRRKPIVVDAVRITRTITIETTEGSITGQPGDYLITDTSGEQYPCESTLFNETYEPIKTRLGFNSLIRKSFNKFKQTTKQIFLEK